MLFVSFDVGLDFFDVVVGFIHGENYAAQIPIRQALFKGLKIVQRFLSAHKI